MAVFLPIQQQSILAGICNKHFLTLVCSVSPTVIGKAARPVALLAGCSVLLLGLITQLSTFAMATDYTTTQTTSLNDGDTITTTADGTAGYGWVAQNGATLTAPGNNVITTNGIAAYGIVLSSPDGAASITATGTKIITIKDHSDAIFATNTGTITLKGVIIDAQGASSYGINISSNTVGSTLTTDDKTTITAMGTGVSGFGNIILTGTQVNAKGDAGIGVSFFLTTLLRVHSHKSLKAMPLLKQQAIRHRGFGAALGRPKCQWWMMVSVFKLSVLNPTALSLMFRQACKSMLRLLSPTARMLMARAQCLHPKSH